MRNSDLKTAVVVALAGAGVGSIGWWYMTKSQTAKIKGLRPEIAASLERIISSLETQGIRVRVIEAYRDPAKQIALYETGTKTSNPVSWHSLGRAVDVQIYDPVAGTWDHKAKRLDLYLAAARAAESEGWRQIGFNPDGSVRTLKTGAGKPYTDPFHWEHRGPYTTLAAAVGMEAPELKRYLA